MSLFNTHLLETILRASSDGVFACDAQMNIWAWNPSMEVLLGISTGAAIGQSLYSLLPEWAGAEAQWAIAQDQALVPKVWPDQKLCNTITGKVHSVEIHFYALSTAAQDVGAGATDQSGILGIVKIQAPAFADYNPYNLLEKNSLVAIQGFGLDGTIHYWNQASTKLYGISSKTAVGQNMDVVFKFTNSEKSIRAIMDQVLLTEQPSLPGEDEVEAMGGRRVWILHAIIPATRQGKITGFFCVDVDTTDRRQVEERLIANQDFMELLLSTMPDFIYIYDLNLRQYQFVNSSVQDLLGYDRAEVLAGKTNLDQLIHPADVQSYRNLIDKIASSPKMEQVHSIEYRQKNNQNEWRWLTDRMRVFKLNENGTPASIIGSRQDITSLKDAERDVQKLLRHTEVKNREIQGQNSELALREEALRETNAELEEKSEELSKKHSELEKVVDELKERNFELDQFVYKISHDIRSPLTSILGLVNLIRMDPDPQVITDSLLHMERSVLRLDNFVKSMLNYAKTSRVESQSQPIDFGQMITQCLSDLIYLDYFDKIEKTIRVEGKVENFRGDRLRIDIILRNLISNSIKYSNKTAASSFLNVFITVQNNVCAITVADNGIGVRAEYQHKVFEMFFRATEKSDGSGLGLYIVKQTVDKMGGNIQMESLHGLGTSITVTLPSV